MQNFHFYVTQLFYFVPFRLSSPLSDIVFQSTDNTSNEYDDEITVKE
jgi:hypothetical protein